MNSADNLQLSHVLYRVQDLHKSVQKLQDAGFMVEYGTTPKKAYNALIWFETGVFIEIHKSSGLSSPIKWLMKTLGYQSVLNRMHKWDDIENGWCEWSLESTNVDLASQRTFFKELQIPFKFHKAKRKDDNGRTLRWELMMPGAIDFPFIMSAYRSNPRPQSIRHPNGIQGVSNIIVGRENLDTVLLEKLMPQQSGLELVDGKKGLQTVEFINSKLTIEKILQSK